MGMYNSYHKCEVLSLSNTFFTISTKFSHNSFFLYSLSWNQTTLAELKLGKRIPFSFAKVKQNPVWKLDVAVCLSSGNIMEWPR